MLRTLAQCQINERRIFMRHGEKIRHQAEDQVQSPRSKVQGQAAALGGRLSAIGRCVGVRTLDFGLWTLDFGRLTFLQEIQHFADAGAQAFVAALQAFQDFDAAGKPASPGAQIGNRLRRGIPVRAEAFVLLALLGQGLAGPDQAALQRLIRLGQLLQLQVQRGEIPRGLLGPEQEALAFTSEGVDLCMGGDGVVVEPRGLTDLFQMFGLVCLDLRLQFGKPCRHFG